MKRLPVPIGNKYGRLLILGEAPERLTPSNGRARRYCYCLCDCGKNVEVLLPDVKGGHTVSCGCSWYESIRKAATSHGKTRTRVYTSWQGMKDRCYNHTSKAYANYGGRGITVCERWMTFQNFYADMGDPPPGRSLDRIDNSKGYSPKNCRWATRKEQNTNQRSNVLIEFDGRTQTLSEWAKEKGIHRVTLRSRLNRGVPVERLFTIPV